MSIAETPRGESAKRNGKLSIPLPFEEAIAAAVEVKPPAAPPKKPRAKKKPTR